MTFDITNLDKLKAKELERMHDEVHVYFNKYLMGGETDYTFRELNYIHYALYNALIRAGGKHISPIDQLDKIQMLEENNPKTKKQKKEFILLEYFKEDEGVKNLWAIQIGRDIFEMDANPLKEAVLFSIKKEVDARGTIIAKGEFKIIENNSNFLSVEFMGEKLKGFYNFQKNQEGSDVWRFSKDGVSEKLSEKFGASLSNSEIRDIYFLSSNKVGASEIANLMSRPVQTIYSWLGKLKQ